MVHLLILNASRNKTDLSSVDLILWLYNVHLYPSEKDHRKLLKDKRPNYYPRNTDHGYLSNDDLFLPRTAYTYMRNNSSNSPVGSVSVDSVGSPVWPVLVTDRYVQ